MRSTAADLIEGSATPGAITQWALRFCQEPETLPVFIAWCRSIWPEMPYSDGEISEDLTRAHNRITGLLHEGIFG